MAQGTFELQLEKPLSHLTLQSLRWLLRETCPISTPHVSSLRVKVQNLVFRDIGRLPWGCVSLMQWFKFACN